MRFFALIVGFSTGVVGCFALLRYEARRQDRTARIQLTSRQNAWGKGTTDTDWVYSYDADSQLIGALFGFVMLAQLVAKKYGVAES